MPSNRKLIIITGTPGVGKSTLARKLARKTGFKRIDISQHYAELAIKYDRKKQCYEIDLKRLQNLIKKEASNLPRGKKLILDSHIAHLLPKTIVDWCIVISCQNLKLLERRLKKRSYSKKKIRENLDAEIFQICLNEAREQGHHILEVEQGKIDLNKILRKICLNKNNP